MVLIEPPSVDATTQPSTAFVPPTASPSSFDATDIDDAIVAPAASVAPASTESPAPPTETAATEVSDEPPNRLRSILLTVAAGLAGIVLALGLAVVAIAVFSHSDAPSTGPGTSTSANQGTDVASASPPPNESRSSGPSANPVSPDKPDTTSPAGQPAVPDQPADKSAAASAADNERPESKPATESAKPDAEQSAPAETGVPIVPPENPDAGEKPPPPPVGRPDPAGPPAFAPKPLGERVMPEPVAGAFSRLLPGAIPAIDKPTEPMSPANTPPDNTTPAEIPAAAPPDVAPNSPEVSRPRPREIDVQARLADPIAQLEFSAIPLADLVQLLSDLSTVPMSLDADAFCVRRIDPWTPVNVKVQETTVRGALAAAVQPLKLGLVVHDGSVVISHPVAADAARRTVAHDLSDLDRGDESEREWLAQTITELIAPDQWTDAGGPNVMRWENGKLTIEADEAVHFEVLLLSDKLRAARKLTPRGKYAPAVVAPDAVATRAAKSLATKITLNFNRPTRLGEIANRFGKAAGIRVLIDWHELTDAGWTTETTATLSVDDLSLDQALEKLLAPRELVYRVIDDATLQITTATAAEQRIDVELHSAAGALKADTDPQALLERLYDKLGARRFRSFGGSGVLRYDATSRCVVALLPWRHQVELSKALAELSAPTAE